MRHPIVIVGANAAGDSAATTLRREGYDGPLVLVGDEPHRPYQRPPLSKEYLRGEHGLDRVVNYEASHYDEHDIELRLGVRATALDTAQQRVHLDDGPTLPYAQLLLATGGRNRRPRIPGIELHGVHDLRTVADADAIRAAAQAGRRAVVVGLGLVGSEVAASLRLLGLEVVAVEPQPTPLSVLGSRVGAVVADLHREHGVQLLLGDAVAAFEGDAHLQAVRTRDGRRLRADLAVVGLGIVPRSELAVAAGMEVADGIVVDEHGRTSAPGVYAAGDVADHHHPRLGRRVRVEHWQHAGLQAASAARNMLGSEEVYDVPHWFWTDQYDLTIQSVGQAGPGAVEVQRGSVEERAVSWFHLDGRRLVAAVGVGRPRDIAVASRLIATGTEVDPDRLADPEVRLRQLLPRP